jgi:hypothetical protein
VRFKIQSRLFWLFALVLHIVVPGVWFFFMAGGFPILHLRFLSNQIIPVVVIVAGVTGLYAGRAVKTALLYAILLSLAAGWIVAALVGIVLYPVSARLITPLAIVVGLLISLSTWKREARRELRSARSIALAILGGAVGVVIPFTQRAGVSSTRPLNVAMETCPAEPAETSPGMVGLSQTLRVAPKDGSITFQRGRRFMTIDPLLTFISRSPDRFWIAFAPHEMREPPHTKLTHWAREGPLLRTCYENTLGSSGLRVSASGDDGAEIETVTRIPEPVYSHLNTFCEISLAGHSKLAIAFSPCPEKRIEVLPMDYPVGRPARLAYVDAHEVFHVIEATSGEKGPYHELAEGKLTRGQPLEITLYDEGQAIAMIAFADWSAQLSTDLSPTAGWGVCTNAIEFSLQGEGMRSGASIFVSLASTSPGRGYDSVGHAPGVYRNRMSVRLQP